MRQAARLLPVICGILLLSVPLTACGPDAGPQLEVTPTFQPRTSEQAAATKGTTVIGPSSSAAGKITEGPHAPAGGTSVAGKTVSPPLPRGMVGESLTLEQVTLAQFINEVFAKTLQLNVQVDQTVEKRTDLVTLRTGRALSANELLAMAEKILAGYGIAVSWDGEVMHIAPNDVLASQMPVLIRSRALPEIPSQLRPIFQIVDLDKVSLNDMTVWLTNAYGTKVKIFGSPGTHSIMVFGLPENVAAVVEAVHVLDQPRFAGKRNIRANPVYWSAPALASKLADVLRAEGYDAGVASNSTSGNPPAILLVPVETNNSLLAFASDPAVLAHIAQWVRDLDTPGQVDPSRNIFIYQVQNTTAASLGQTVDAVLSGRSKTGTSNTPEVRLEQAGRTTQNAPGQTTNPQTASAAATAAAGGGAQTGSHLVVDEARNALIFVGTAVDYSHVQQLLETLDKPPREALIEVTVAEVSLSDSSALGVEFTVPTNLPGGYTSRLGTGSNVLAPTTNSTSSSSSSTSGSSSGLSVGSTGFNWAILNNVGDMRFLLNAYSQSSKVTVLSTPRIVAKSGGEAKIEVGTEVPIITSQGTTNTIQNAGTSGILQSIEYRKTGVLLTVDPVVHSGNQIDLKVSQEVSQAIPNSTPGISSPLIQNRNVDTQVTLTDGQTVVIGGMITENRTSSDAGVPYLKDIPGLGLLFNSQSPSKERNELLVFITPYVISDSGDSQRITEQFREQMQAWPKPSGELHW